MTYLFITSLHLLQISPPQYHHTGDQASRTWTLGWRAQTISKSHQFPSICPFDDQNIVYIWKHCERSRLPKTSSISSALHIENWPPAGPQGLRQRKSVCYYVNILKYIILNIANKTVENMSIFQWFGIKWTKTYEIYSIYFTFCICLLLGSGLRI
jgi:hypothetical protein